MGPRVRTTAHMARCSASFFAKSSPASPHGGWRRLSTAGLHLCDGRRKCIPCRGRNRWRRERFNVGAGAPQTVNRLVELLGGDVVYLPKRPGEPDCTFADIGRSRRVWAGGGGSVRAGRPAHDTADRSLEGRAIVGSGFDRAGDEDLVRISRRQIAKGAG